MIKAISHSRETDGHYEELKVHLHETACMSKQFASAFGADEWGELVGLAHDIGKYSHEFQDRILNNGPKVDHSTAGALEMFKCGAGMLPAFCIAGHHGGLPNGGSDSDNCDASTLSGRRKKNIPQYCDFVSEITLSRPSSPPILKFYDQSKRWLSCSFFTRMLYSCLVDADYLCTERFMLAGDINRGHFESIEILSEKLNNRVGSFENPKSDINKKRTEILQQCLTAATNDKGLFSMTVPTGGGKTISSLAFALNHAKIHNMQRVIYVIPYTSIIEQNARVFKDIVGENNVVEHHANFDFDNSDDSDKSPQRFATENWDAPLIVTTNVQFFESLFANKSSRCRKLHNIANSVIIFDEVQMLPTKFLLPCIHCISELVQNYGCSVVMCSATQPSLNKFFKHTIGSAREICENTEALFDFFGRTTFCHLGEVSDEVVSNQLNELNQVLCIVNSRKQAQKLFELIDGEGRFHLSTMMCPEHRIAVLDQIRQCLNENRPCRVVSTSLIEAGVDVDFPVVYRSMAGLDSIVQAAGRCNREGRFPKEQSFTYIFTPSNDYKLPSSIEQTAAVASSVVSRHPADFESLTALDDYFNSLHSFKGLPNLDAHNIIEKLNRKDLRFPFADVAEAFKLIDESTVSIIIPIDDGQAIVDKIRALGPNRALMRAAGRYSVNVYENHFSGMWRAGMLEKINDNLFVLAQLDNYSQDTGLVSSIQ